MSGRERQVGSLWSHAPLLLWWVSEVPTRQRWPLAGHSFVKAGGKHDYCDDWNPGVCRWVPFAPWFLRGLAQALSEMVTVWLPASWEPTEEVVLHWVHQSLEWYPHPETHQALASQRPFTLFQGRLQPNASPAEGHGTWVGIGTALQLICPAPTSGCYLPHQFPCFGGLWPRLEGSWLFSIAAWSSTWIYQVYYHEKLSCFPADDCSDIASLLLALGL